MKYLKYFETGECNRNIDWEYVKNNPDDDSEEYAWIKIFQDQFNILISLLNNPKIFEILDIK
jgi:hypothetical protein